MTWLLFKVRLQSILAGFGKKGAAGTKKGGKGKTIAFAVVMLYVAVVFFGLMFAVCNEMCEPFCSAGLGWFYFSFSGIMAFLLCFVGTVFATGNQLYNSKDNELLMSMPVKPGAILKSRMMVLMLSNYMYASVVLIPAGIVWCMHQPVTVLGVISYVLACIALPFMAMALSCLLGWLIALASSKLRNKNAITLIISIGFFAVYMYFCTTWTKYLEKLIANGTQIADAVKRAVFPAYHFGVAAAEGNVLSLVMFILCAIIPFAVVYAVLRHNFINIATANRGAAKKKYKAKQMKSGSGKAALLKKEIRHYLSNPMYIMNASIGVVLMVLFAGYALISRGKLMLMLSEMGLSAYAGAAVCAVLCFGASMVFVSAPSISLEGKCLWLTQSLPVKTRDVLNAKALCHIAVTLPLMLLAAVLCIAAVGATALQTAAIIIVPSVLTVFGAYLGVAVNLKFPKFDWISETHCVKQSASVMIVMFGMMAIIAVAVILYMVVFAAMVAPEAYMLILGALFAALTAVLYKWIMSRGCRIFDRL